MEAYFDGYSSEVHVSEQFQAPEALDFEILVAIYEQEQYEGSAYVLARKDGLLFEVEGGHCSCYGLEGQWKPTEVSISYLLNRLEKGWFAGGGQFKDAIRKVLESL